MRVRVRLQVFVAMIQGSIRARVRVRVRVRELAVGDNRVHSNFGVTQVLMSGSALGLGVGRS